MRGFLVLGFGMVVVLEWGRVMMNDVGRKWNELDGVVLWVLYSPSRALCPTVPACRRYDRSGGIAGAFLVVCHFPTE